MKKINSIILMFSIIITIVFSSCGKKLEKEEAKEIILKKFTFPETIYGTLQRGEVCYCVNFGGTDLTPEKSLAEKNLISFKYIRNRGGDMFSPMSYACYNIELTQEGEKYSCKNNGFTDKEGRTYINVRVAEKVFGEITEIREIETNDLKTYKVCYTWKYSNITPFEGINHLRIPNTRSYSEGETFKEEVKMVKYDAGWRIEKE